MTPGASKAGRAYRARDRPAALSRSRHLIGSQLGASHPERRRDRHAGQQRRARLRERPCVLAGLPDLNHAGASGVDAGDPAEAPGRKRVAMSADCLPERLVVEGLIPLELDDRAVRHHASGRGLARASMAWLTATGWA